jgi:hypothetical protein
MGKLVLSDKEMLLSQNPVLTIAHKLREAGAPVKFNIFDLFLKPEGVEVEGPVSTWRSPDTDEVTFVW